MLCRLRFIWSERPIKAWRCKPGSAMSVRSPSTPSAFLIGSDYRQPGRPFCAAPRSVLPAARSGRPRSAPAPPCTGRPGRELHSGPSLRAMTLSTRDGDAVERGVTIDEIDALPGDQEAAMRRHQPVQRGAREYPLLLAPIFDQHEF